MPLDAKNRPLKVGDIVSLRGRIDSVGGKPDEPGSATIVLCGADGTPDTKHGSFTTASGCLNLEQPYQAPTPKPAVVTPSGG